MSRHTICICNTRSTQLCIPPGSLYPVPSSAGAGVKARSHRCQVKGIAPYCRQPTFNALRYGNALSRDLTVLPAHPRIYPRTEWTIPAFAFPAKAGTHLPTPKRWKAELAWVTLCDPIWHVISHSGVVISITNCYIHVYFTLRYTVDIYISQLTSNVPLSTVGGRAFSIASLQTYNSLADNVTFAKTFCHFPEKTNNISFWTFLQQLMVQAVDLYHLSGPNKTILLLRNLLPKVLHVTVITFYACNSAILFYVYIVSQ